MIIILLLALIASSASLSAQEFTARADKVEVPLDGTFRVIYTLENLDAKQFTPPDFSPFTAYGPSQSTNMSWINGQMSRSVTYTYTLKPNAEGEFEIPPATANVSGKTRKTNPVNIRVLPAGSPSTGQEDAGRDDRSAGGDDLEAQISENLFVRVVPSKSEVYEGEQLTLTYKLYQALSLDDLSILKMPNFDGFLSYDIEQTENQPQIETYNGQRYNTQVLHQSALFASKSGNFTIAPMELNALVLVRKEDPGFFFPRTERMKFEFKSNSVAIKVKPLPSQGRPEAFTGAVGQYDFSVSYDKTRTQVDDPVTLKIKVSGSGNIKIIDVPKPEFPQSFEVYDPKVNETVSGKSQTVNGEKTWEYLIIPRGGGSFQFPDITFSYYDLSSGKYVTRTEPGPLLEVEGAPLSPQNYPSGGFNKEDVAMLGEDIRFIKTGKMPAASSSVNLITRPVFHLLTWLPVIMALFFPLINSRRKKRSGDAVALRSRKAHKEAGKRMTAARKLMSSGDDKAFYNEVVKSIWGYLSDKFDLQNTDLSQENTKIVLGRYGIAEDLQEDTRKLIETCEMAIYAPLGPGESKEGIVNRASDLIEKLENSIRKA